MAAVGTALTSTSRSQEPPGFLNRTLEVEGASRRYQAHLALATLDRTLREFSTDPDRVYLVGDPAARQRPAVPCSGGS